MPSQEAPSKREIAEYVDKTDFADDGAQTAVEPDLADIEIAVLAYQLWEGRGRPFGSDLEDWFNAERELKTNGYRDPGVATS